MKGTVLIIDDEEPIRYGLRVHLEKAGFIVIESDGSDGTTIDGGDDGNKTTLQSLERRPALRELIEEGGYDVIISDVMMPSIKGTDVLRMVKERHSLTPVILLTGLINIDSAVSAMREGAFDYLTKPILKENLIVSVERALNNRAIQIKNLALEEENKRYRKILEDQLKDTLAERTLALEEKNVELNRAYTHLKKINTTFANALGETIEAKDTCTHGHCQRMRELSLLLGEAAGLEGSDLETLELASLLHDLGKVSISESTLNKEGPLDETERKHMMTHPYIGEKILRKMPYMEDVAEVVGGHHENYDGSGYPRGLKGEDIPIGARIISVIDLFDAMNNTRPYRKKKAMDEIIEEMKRVRGSQLDPNLVDIFINDKIYLKSEISDGTDLIAG